MPPGNAFVGDRQALDRNSNLAPDWLRIGTDIIGGTPAPRSTWLLQSLGRLFPNGTSGQANCDGKTISALAEQFGGIYRLPPSWGSRACRRYRTDSPCFAGHSRGRISSYVRDRVRGPSHGPRTMERRAGFFTGTQRSG